MIHEEYGKWVEIQRKRNDWFHDKSKVELQEENEAYRQYQQVAKT